MGKVILDPTCSLPNENEDQCCYGRMRVKSYKYNF